MKRALFAFFALLAIAIAAGCGGRRATPFVMPAATPSPASILVGASPAAVSIASGGYGAQFTLPALSGGSPTTMTAQLSTAATSGVPAPAALQRSTRRSGAFGKPLSLGQTVTALVYLDIQTAATVTFPAIPNFVFTLPGGVTIPAGDQVYLAYYDPTQSANGWLAALGPAAVSGGTVTFTGISQSFTFVANKQYIFAVIAAGGAVSNTPSYCQGFATAAPISSLGGFKTQPVTFTDNSGLSGDVVFYVTDTGQVNGQTPVPMWLNQQGQWVMPSPGQTAPPLPLKCFPGSRPGDRGLQFNLPIAVSGRMYIAYAPPAGGAIPNPLKIGAVQTGAAPFVGIQAPAVDWRSGVFALAPFDVVEYCLSSTGCIMDTTQENAVGLPLEISQPALNVPASLPPGQGPQTAQGAVTLGFDSGAYQQVLSDLQNLQTYSVLPTYTSFNGSNILLRIVAPQSDGDYGFPQDWWYNNNNYMYGMSTVLPINSGPATYYPATYAKLNQGYVGYLLQSYASSPQLYTLQGTSSTKFPTTNDNYCASADTTNGNVLFVEVGSATACAVSPTPMPGGNSYAMPAFNALEGSPFGTGDQADGYCNTAIFAMAPGGPAGPLTDWNLFYLWKAMVTDIARGVALDATATQPHPFGTWNTNPSGHGNKPSPAFSAYWKDAVYDQWAYVLHNRMHNNLAYALPYDEPGGMSTSFEPSLTGQTLSITVQTIPAAPANANLVPTTGGNSPPWPTPAPLACPASPIAP